MESSTATTPLTTVRSPRTYRAPGYRVEGRSRVYLALERGVDVVLATVGLVLTAPLWLVVAALVKLEDGGPVFFSQMRVGKGGELFRSWKFRTMTPRQREATVPGQAGLEESRFLRVGRILRATALDELPQLWNVLRGDMSMVGPRAHVPVEREVNGSGQPVDIRRIPGFSERHSVRPGLTGIAQVRAPRDITRRKKFRYDLLYVRRRTLWLDLALILRSVWISLTGGWPRVGKTKS